MTDMYSNNSVQICFPNESIVSHDDFFIYLLNCDKTTEVLKFILFLHVVTPLIILWLCLNRKEKFRRRKITEVNVKSETNIKVILPQQVLWKPSGRCHSLFIMKLSPSKDTSLLDLDDIQKIRYIENRESQEDEKDYNTGGYMPISIGDILKGQYKVCRKLGWGHFSTVWLCQNLSNDGPNYVALKICKSAQMFTVVAQDEIKLLRDTKLIDPSHIGYKHIVQMVDTFKLLSVNGVHTAISMEIMGPSLLHLLIQSDFRGIHLSGVKRIITQVLKGLTYLHDACRIIHTDIKPENILIKVDENYIKSIIGKTEKFSELGIDMPRSYVAADCWIDRDKSLKDSDENILSKFEEQRGQSYPYDKFLGELPDFRRRHAEPRLNAPMWVSPNIEIKIADLGNACWEEHHFSSEIQTRQYRALEVILGAGYSFPADIWSVGCMGFEMATGEMLFSPKGDREPSANLDHLCLIWETLGSIPQYITENGTHARQYFINGQLCGVDKKLLRIWKIEDVLVEKYKWKRVDAIPFAGFLESLIEPDPALRFTASTALESEWITMVD
ncbi:SRSF protein kinase 2-like isoform X1 [Diorhabda sublineata]|uniref:SRSF protein kinase 2-like isoform X1 n=1 Tax=Diorhabda sublineata TaxID=1163346 RepID=UPI0024E0D3E5|nr:SRSF protein kinase 2-like isoform X1 [Diorhabda sublineata]